MDEKRGIETATRVDEVVARVDEHGDDRHEPAALLTDRAARFVPENPAIFSSAFPLDRPVPFSLIVAGKAEAAFDGLRQAVSSVQGALAQESGSGLEGRHVSALLHRASS